MAEPTVSRARYALTLRLAQHVEGSVEPPKTAGVLERVINTTNDLLPLWTAYEAAVRAEALRDVRAEVWGTVRDRLDTLLAHTDDPALIAHLDGLRRWTRREQATPAPTRLTSAALAGGTP